MRSPKLSDADIARGKTMLKAEVLYAADNDATFLENIRQQAILRGRVHTPSNLVVEIDKITTSEVKSVRNFMFPMMSAIFLFSFVNLLFQYYEIFLHA